MGAGAFTRGGTLGAAFGKEAAGGVRTVAAAMTRGARGFFTGALRLGTFLVAAAFVVAAVFLATRFFASGLGADFFLTARLATAFFATFFLAAFAGAFFFAGLAGTFVFFFLVTAGSIPPLRPINQRARAHI